MADWPEPEEAWKDEKLDAKWEDILGIRDSVLKLLELKREAGMIGSSLEAALSVYSPDDSMMSFIKENIDLFPKLFKVSQAGVVEASDPSLEDVGEGNLKIGINPAAGTKCQRCWNFSDTVGDSKEYPDICERCYNVLIERSSDG